MYKKLLTFVGIYLFFIPIVASAHIDNYSFLPNGSPHATNISYTGAYVDFDEDADACGSAATYYADLIRDDEGAYLIFGEGALSADHYHYDYDFSEPAAVLDINEPFWSVLRYYFESDPAGDYFNLYCENAGIVDYSPYDAGGEDPDDFANEATSTLDQSQQNFSNAIALFLGGVFLMLYIFKKSS